MRIPTSRTFVLSAVGALALSLTFLSPAGTAQAAPLGSSALTTTIDEAPVEMQRRGAFRGGGGGRGGFRGGRGGRGIGPAGIIGLGAAAVILGGAAAAAASGPRDCWVERRWVEGPYGPEPRRVRVCN